MVSKLRQLFITFIVVCLLFDSVVGQRKTDRRKGRPKSRGRPRGRQPEPDPSAERINCYFCSVNFVSTKFDPTNLCYNPAKNMTAADNDFLTTCSKPTKFCSVEITRLGGALVSIDRKCGGSTCNYFCIHKAYGVDIETCTYCCPGKTAIDLDLLEEGEDVPVYHCPIPNTNIKF